MRLDKYLFAARVFKSRTLAGEAAASSMIFVDNITAKPSREIKIGYVIEIDTLLFYKKLKVLKIPLPNLPKSAASTLYELLDERTKA